MAVTITPQTIITAAAFIAAIGGIWAVVRKLVRFIDRQQAQDEEIAHNREERNEQIDKLQEKHDADVRAIKEEQTLLVYGQLACLKGLKEQGCNGPVTEAIKMIEKHLNKEAHK